jgi:abortive infection bacteriophage resistance protein
MKYTKPPITLDQQADQLLRRGMTGDRSLMVAQLARVNYYRLTAYWLPFRTSDETFKPGTTFDEVWNRYVFDRRLRLMVMDATERIEIAVRTQLAFHHAHGHGIFAYADDPKSLPKLNAADRRKFVERVDEETDRSREQFVRHFRTKYGDAHRHLPVWMVTEVMTFGTILTFFRGCSHHVKKAVATLFQVPAKVFDSWLLTLNAVRNICAHHGRLWNRELGVKPLIPLPPTYPDWHAPVEVDNNRVFAVLTICRHCLQNVAPQSGWADRLRALFTEFPGVPLPSMGFPVDWEKCPIWAASAAASKSLGHEGKGTGVRDG